MSSPFLRFAEVVQGIADTRSTHEKTALFTEYLLHLSLPDRALVVRFMADGAFASTDDRRTQLGHRTISVAAADFCEIDYERVFKPSRAALGSSSETISRLLDFWPEALTKRSIRNWTIQEVDQMCIRLAEAKKKEDKLRLLHELFSSMQGIEVKYLLRILQQGSLRIGFELRSMVKSIAELTGYDVEAVRFAHTLCGSLEQTVIYASEQRLADISFRLFHPIAFMLASPLESRTISQVTDYISEEKFDGMRCQIHADGRHVKLFSRDLNDITSIFPDVEQHLANYQLPGLILDGELVVYREQRIQSFNDLPQRMGVKRPSDVLLKHYPVLFIAYDLVAEQHTPLFRLPLMARKERLNHWHHEKGLAISRWQPLPSEQAIVSLFQRARAHGNEGLMLKHKESMYEYGQRGKWWLKVKEPGGSLDTVIMYAHAGSGKRGGTYSDFTLGVRVADDERYEEAFIPIGKAYGGYSNEELNALNTAIKPLIVEKYGPTVGLKPGIVVELEFDGIQVNKRTKAGYTLRFPRFRRIRWDLSPTDCDTLNEVERLFHEKNDEPRVDDAEMPSFLIK